MPSNSMQLSRRGSSRPALLRMGAIASILGAVLLFASTSLHPLDADPNDFQAAIREYAAADIWVGSHLGQFLGVLLIVGGLTALYRTFAEGWGRALGLLGFVGAVVGLAVSGVLQAVDGIALKVMADAWANAGAAERPAAYFAVLAVREIEIGLASVAAFIFGVTLILFGSAMVLCDEYPTWTGWLAVVAGIGTALGGVTMAYTGFSALALGLNVVSSLPTLVWLVAIGILMWRRAGATKKSA